MKTYLQGLHDAAEVAEGQAADDAKAADASTSLDARLEYRAQQQRALAIAIAILDLQHAKDA